MIHLVHVHRADAIDRGDQPRLGVLREVAAVPKTKVAQLHHHGDAVGVVGRVLLDPFELVSQRVAGGALWGVDEFFHRGDAADAHFRLAVHLLERQQCAGLHDVALADLHVAVWLDAQQERGVGSAVRVACRDAVVPDIPDRHFLRQLSRTSEVVDVKVRGDQVIDLLHAGHLGCGLVKAPGIAPARHAGVDEDRFPGGCDDQRATAALDVDPVNVESLRVLGGGRTDDQQRSGRYQGFEEGFNLHESVEPDGDGRAGQRQTRCCPWSGAKKNPAAVSRRRG